MPRDVYFWEPEVSPHKIPLFRAVNRSPLFGKAYYVAQCELSGDRVRQGWSDNAQPSELIEIGPTPQRVDQIIEQSSPRSIHIFSGLRRVPCIVQGIDAAVKHDRDFGILHEPRTFEGLAGYARLFQSLLTESKIKKSAKFILAIGRHGPDWFRISGYDNRRIFPFAYFIDKPKSVIHDVNPIPHVAYLGRLEKAKGADLFAKAIRHIKSEVKITIAGSGSLKDTVSEACSQDRKSCNYVGPIPMTLVPNFLSTVDVLVSPSITKDDGWGVTVSEGLLAGAYVMASDKVGSSMCLQHERGEVLRTLAPKMIASAIDDHIARAVYLRPEHRLSRSRWASDHLTVEAGVRLLWNIVNGNITPPRRGFNFITEVDLSISEPETEALQRSDFALGLD